MREKYESLSLAALRDIAKARKLKGVSTMKKSELIELMLEQDEKDKAKEVKEEIKNEKAGVADIEQLFVVLCRMDDILNKFLRGYLLL